MTLVRLNEARWSRHSHTGELCIVIFQDRQLNRLGLRGALRRAAYLFDFFGLSKTSLLHWASCPLLQRRVFPD